MAETSIRTRTFLFFLSAGLLVMIVFSVISFRVADHLLRTTTVKSYSEQLLAMRMLLTSQIDNYVLQVESYATYNPDLELLLSRRTTAEYLQRETDPVWNRVLPAMKRNKSQSGNTIRVVYAGSENHGQLYSNLNQSTAGKGYDCRQRPWYIATRQSLKTTIASYGDFNREKAAVTIATPVISSANGEYLGAYGADISVQQILKTLRYTGQDHLLTLQVADESGRILSVEDTLFSGATLKDTVWPDGLTDSMFTVWTSGLNPDSVSVTDLAGRYLLGIRLAQPGWYLIGTLDQAEIRSGLTRIVYMLILFNLVALAGLVVLLWIFSGKIIRPIKAMTQMMSQVASGGGFKFTGSSLPDREMQELQSAILSVSKAQAAVIERIKDAGIQLSMVSDRINGMMGTFRESTVHLSSSVAQTTSSMEEMAATGDQISQSAGEVNRLATRTSVSARNGEDSFNELVRQMEGIRRQNEQRSQDIIALSKKASRITEIISIISGINEQTKIIAFNAALEASNAGETGKRFEVVAGEIRRLADTVQESTDEVKAMIREMQESVQNLIKNSEEAGKTIYQGVGMVRDLSVTMRDFAGSAEETSQSAGQIQQSTTQQKVAGEEIVSTLHLITRTMDQLAAMSGELSATADELNDLSVKLVEMAIINA
ncbi:MAG: methyl-accepting chemotaxis protein [Bacteroidetes bacterium]|nr:methyl-accepting chemotaxis protein [Bacteroidota bacterium]